MAAAGPYGTRFPKGAFEVVAVLRPPEGRRLASSSGSIIASMRAEGRAVEVFEDAFAPGRGTSAVSVGTRDEGTATRHAGDANAETNRAGSWPQIVTVGTDDWVAAGDLLEEMKRDGNVQHCYVAPSRTVLSRASGANARRTSPEKPALHWGLDCVNAHGLDARGVFVGVVDTGVDRKHPDLKDAVFSYQNFTQESEKDTDGHGTHVCGIIAGRGAWPNGMKGVSDAQLVVCKGMGERYSATAYYRALRAASEGAKIVNVSLGGPTFDQAENDIVVRAQGHGVLFIAAMGNNYENGNEAHYPAALKGVVAVGAVGENLKRAKFSNTGKHIAVVAPGVDVWSTIPTHKCNLFPKQRNYAASDGTSMATPFVAGVAAILYAQKQPTDASIIASQIPVQLCPGQAGRTNVLGRGVVTFKGVSQPQRGSKRKNDELDLEESV